MFSNLESLLNVDLFPSYSHNKGFCAVLKSKIFPVSLNENHLVPLQSAESAITGEQAKRK